MYFLCLNLSESKKQEKEVQKLLLVNRKWLHIQIKSHALTQQTLRL